MQLASSSLADDAQRRLPAYPLGVEELDDHAVLPVPFYELDVRGVRGSADGAGSL